MSISPRPPKLQDVILIEFSMKGSALQALMEAVARISAELSIPPGGEQVCCAEGEPRVTIYLRGLSAATEIEAARTIAGERLRRLADGEIEVSRLAGIRIYAGASSEATPNYHYVVRTDVAPGGEKELERWYDEEHMPSLAAVPGVVLAQRLVSLDASPRYYACYDLTTPDVLKSPPWQAVRGTDWSGRVRPTFRHTRRIMSRRVMEMDSLKAAR
jgi:hypothetical protein